MSSVGYWAAVFAMTLAAVAAAVGAFVRVVKAQQESPQATFQVPSSLDGELQPCLFVPAKSQEPRPLVVALHPWSHGFDTYASMVLWERTAEARDWHYLQPHFRGPNRRPDACASAKARQDILDAVDYVLKHYKVDERRVYLVGGSGGGHMALVMAAHAPKRWAAVSAWCPIADLRAWHDETKAAGRTYWSDIEAACGGAPGSSEEVDRQFEYRSPVFHLANAKGVPLDINTGIHDGHTGSVPIHHAIDAFDAIARARGDSTVSDADIARLSSEQPLDVPAEQDETYGRHIYLRRYSGPSRITIFEGGHEGEALAETAFCWLEKQSRDR